MRSILLSVFFLFNIQLVFCQWENLNTGLTDDLSGVVFLGDNGLVSGKNGLYYTTTGGLGASSWKKFEITDNVDNIAIYKNTNFTHCFSDTNGSASTGFVFACGQNTLTKQAIIIKIELPSLIYEIIYIGEVNSKLNQITYSYNNRSYVAVGENGLIVTFASTGIVKAKNISADNFSSITFNGQRCKIAATGKILYFEYFDSNYSYKEMLTPGSDIKAIAYGSGRFSGGVTFGAGNRFLRYDIYNSLSNNHTNFYNGPLNAKCISASSDSEYVGTDHGIYYVANSQALEWQSTSSNYGINCFWKQMANETLYACGNSGVILKTSNGGGTRVPYVSISEAIGGCVGGTVSVEPITGSVKSCQWYVDNLKVNSACGNLLYNFKTVGSHEIRYSVTNFYGVESSDVKTIYISPIPKINLPVIISDNILCKSEPITIQIQNSEVDVVYTLRSGASRFGTSGPGNGQTISFISNQITESGDYFLEAKNKNAACVASFTDRFYITVEHTKAEFHKDLINAKPNETTVFYQKAIDAQNYKWDFAPNASLATSNGTQENVSFSKEGDTKIDLEVWSNNGCYDKIQKEGPFVYNNPENSNKCWALINNGVDSEWNGYEYEGNNGLTPTEDGFLVTGGFNDQIFDSKTGVKPNYKNKKGGFLTKYDRDGVLKWIVSTEHDPRIRERDIIYSSVVDHDGNIYICGTHEGTFIDNKGERIKVSPVIGSSSNIGYIIKLDKQGKIIWKLNSTVDGPLAKKLYIDKENNLVTTIQLNYVYEDKFQLYLNGKPSTIINQKVVRSQADNLTMLKISPAGSVIWYSGITIRYVNSAGIVDVGFDKDNNLYVGGNYEFDADFYSAGNTATPEVLKGFEGYGAKMFLVKYNKDGVLQWKVRSNTKDASSNGVSLSSMVTDENGGSYITGTNRCDIAKAVHFFENADGTITQKSIGSFFLAKVNSLGKCEWITGSQYASSRGAKMIRDKDKLHIIGNISGTGSFVASNGQSHDLSMSSYDFFLATYDLSGNLKKITANGDNKNHVNVPHLEMFDFFKAEDGSFYLSSNLRGNNYSSFGSILTTNGIDGTVIHFDENCGIVKYENTLSTEDFGKNSNAVIYPNPTSGKISVDLKSYSGNVIVQIYDVNGKKLSEEKAIDLTKLNLTINGSQGLYFVKIKAGENIQTFKVLKQ